MDSSLPLGACNKLLGSGSYGTVVPSDKFPDIAIKIISGENFESIIKEVSLLCSLNHPNIISANAISFADGNCRICMPKYKCDLRKVLHDFNYKEILHISRQIIEGIDYLHRMQVIHCDLKPGNILINEDFKVVICDFGISCIYNEGNMISSIQTKNYRAPEVNDKLKMSKITPKIDIWSLGCILFELFNGTPLVGANICASDSTLSICKAYGIANLSGPKRESRYKGLKSMNKDSIVNKIIDLLSKDSIRKWDSEKSKHYINLIAMCLMPDRSKRINSREALKYIYMLCEMDKDFIDHLPIVQFGGASLGELPLYKSFEDKSLFTLISLKCCNYANDLFLRIQKQVKNISTIKAVYGVIYIAVCVFGENYRNVVDNIEKQIKYEDLFQFCLSVMNWTEYRIIDFQSFYKK